MNTWENILDEEILKRNIIFSALFIMNFECLKDFIITKPREFLGDICIKDGKIIIQNSNSYKEVTALDNNIEYASLKWLMHMGAITNDDIALYGKIKERRNELTHELLSNLYKGDSDKDVNLFIDSLKLNQKLDKWWINDIEIPTSWDEIPQDYDDEGVIGFQGVILSIINDIALASGGNRYQSLLNALNSDKET